MTQSQQLASAPLPAQPRPRRWRGLTSGLLSWPALLGVLAAIPSLVLAVGVIQHHDQQVFAGDQATVELSTREAEHFSRTLGPYSRYGWNHPGPLWFYALAVPYRLLGNDSLALALGVLLLQAGFAVLLVLAADRWLGRTAGVATLAGVVLLYVGQGGDVMRAVWNPYALLLPTVLLLVLAAVAAGTGSPRALAAGALTASFLVQTHVGTVVPVAALVVTAGPAWAVVWWRRGHRVTRAEGYGTALLAGLTVLAWVPPVVQQLRPGTGNMTLMLDFARQPRGSHSFSEAVAGLGGQLLVVPSAGHLPADAITPTSPSGRETAAVILLLVGCLLLAWVAARLRRWVSFALALLVAVTALASILSIAQIDGPIYSYLIVWQSVLPIALLAGVAGLVPEWSAVSRRLASRAGPRRSAAFAVPATALAAVVLVAAVTGSALYVAHRSPPLTSPAGVPAAVALTLPDLPKPSAGPVRLRIGSSDAWPTASGLLLALEQRGWDGTVTSDWSYVFGGDEVSRGKDTSEIVLVDAEALPGFAALPDARLLGPVPGLFGPLTLLLRTEPSGALVPAAPGDPTGGPG